MEDAEQLKAVIEEVSWHNYTKKCKHCGKNNTYRMEKSSFNIDWTAISSFLDFASDAFERLKKVIKDKSPPDSD